MLQSSATRRLHVGADSPCSRARRIAARLALAAFLSVPIGLDRELREHQAGLRTHMLIAVTACAFTVGAWELFQMSLEMTDRPSSDPIRVIEAVTAGVAFLAAGAIIRSSGRIHGLTTGAGMWMAGSIGMASGLGFYAFACLLGLTGFVIVTVLRLLERWL